MTRSPPSLADVADGTSGCRPAPGPTWSGACGARPSWSSTGGCCAPCASLRNEVLEPAPGLLADVLAALEEAGERRAVRSLLHRHRVAYVGGLAAATAAGAAGAIVIASRSRRHRPALAG